MKGIGTTDGGVASCTVNVARTARLGGVVALVYQVMMAIIAGDTHVFTVHGVIERAVCAQGFYPLVPLSVTGVAGRGPCRGGSDNRVVAMIARQVPFLDVTVMFEENRSPDRVEHDAGRRFGSVFRRSSVAYERGCQADTYEEVREIRFDLEAHGRANGSDGALLVDRMGPKEGKRKLNNALSPL
nr:hypothetical protein [Desulfofustis glycolicus]